jgi:hypothetical protein
MPPALRRIAGSRFVAIASNLARKAKVHDLVTREISGHLTERMQRHYSTAQREEMLSAVSRVVSFLGPNQ